MVEVSGVGGVDGIGGIGEMSGVMDERGRATSFRVGWRWALIHLRRGLLLGHSAVLVIERLNKLGVLVRQDERTGHDVKRASVRFRASAEGLISPNVALEEVLARQLS